MKRALVVIAVLLTMAACGRSSSSELRTVEVRIEHSRFLPDDIRVRAGETVRFVVVNGDPIDHEFLVGDEGVQKIHERGTEAHHGARPGEISIPAGDTKTTTYTFSEPGSLIYGCHLPGHYDNGMRGQIAIG